MKAITLWQPWATLVALNGKRFETRSWPTTYRGPLAIHAGKNKVLLDAILSDSPPPDLRDLRRLLKSANLDALDKFPLGCIVATVDLVGCYRTESLAGSRPMTANERTVGDFSPGRFAWALDTPKQVDPPVSAAGAMGLWEWTPPESPLAITGEGLGLFD